MDVTTKTKTKIEVRCTVNEITVAKFENRPERYNEREALICRFATADEVVDNHHAGKNFDPYIDRMGFRYSYNFNTIEEAVAKVREIQASGLEVWSDIKLNIPANCLDIEIHFEEVETITKRKVTMY